jgi:hypothetical protein
MAGDASGALRLSEAAAAMRAHGQKLRSYAKDAPEKGDFTVVGLDMIITIHDIMIYMRIYMII